LLPLLLLADTTPLGRREKLKTASEHRYVTLT